MDENLSAAHRLYEGFAAHDADAILAVLHDDFVGHVSAGMPLGVGGAHHGPSKMLADVWARVFSSYDVIPVADELLVSGPDRIVAVGGYRGKVRDSLDAVDAAMAHVLRFRDGKVSELVQITDTASWPVAAD